MKNLRAKSCLLSNFRLELTTCRLLLLLPFVLRLSVACFSSFALGPLPFSVCMSFPRPQWSGWAVLLLTTYLPRIPLIEILLLLLCLLLSRATYPAKARRRIYLGINTKDLLVLFQCFYLPPLHNFVTVVYTIDYQSQRACLHSLIRMKNDRSMCAYSNAIIIIISHLTAIQQLFFRKRNSVGMDGNVLSLISHGLLLSYHVSCLRSMCEFYSHLRVSHNSDNLVRFISHFLIACQHKLRACMII